MHDVKSLLTCVYTVDYNLNNNVVSDARKLM